jgi:hypothetical protein
MFHRSHVATAALLAATVAMPALLAPAAVAEAPKCKTKANKYVACTDKLRANIARKQAKDRQLDVESYSWGSVKASKPPRLAK